MSNATPQTSSSASYAPSSTNPKSTGDEMQQNDFTDVASGEPLKTYTFRLPDDLPEDDVTALREAVESFRCGPKARLNGSELTFILPEDTVIEELTYNKMPTEVTGRVCGLATTSASQGDAHTAFVLSVKGHGTDSRHHRFSVYPNTRIRPIGTKGSPNLALVPSDGIFDCRISLHRGEVEGTKRTKKARNADWFTYTALDFNPQEKCSVTYTAFTPSKKHNSGYSWQGPREGEDTPKVEEDKRPLRRIVYDPRFDRSRRPVGKNE
jgi:hypothetical protein